MKLSAHSTEPRRIQPLPTHLANQIAAGEVVERPASVVKELLENSIDAGARHIELEIEQGGIKLIRVHDDGNGIHPDDLPLTVAPHATSKIYSQQELQQIHSLGFRGEALASIASVSRFAIASRQSAYEQGQRLDASSANGGISPCAMPPGTRIEVRDLFYNTPARRKFLRTERTEFLHVEEVVKRLALSRYDVGFRFLHNGRQLFNLSPIERPEQYARRVATLLGKGLLQHTLGLEFEAAGMKLWGWVGEPGYSRSQADAQYFYLNGRMIRDKLVSHALRQAHQGVLEPGRHPAYLLYLELDPQLFDINVHPTKHEVRFRESRMVHDFLFRALARLFSDSDESPRLVEQTESVSGVRLYPSSPSPRPAQLAEQHAFYRHSLDTAQTQKPAVAAARGEGGLLAVAHGRYLLLQREGEPGILAVERARQLLLYRRFLEAMDSGEMVSQPLLIPATVKVGVGEIALLEHHATTLLRLGVVIERLGEEAVVLRQLPPLLRGVNGAALVETLSAFLSTSPDLSLQQEHFLQTLAERLVPLMPQVDMASAKLLLHELQQLEQEGTLNEQALPWLPLTEERLAALFAAKA